MGPSLPYREAASLPVDPPDPEALAFDELARRAKAVRVAVGFACAFAGVGAGTVAYILVAAAFLDRVHAYSPYLNGVLAVLPAGLATWWSATRIGRAIVARRSRAWIPELVARYGVDRQALDRFSRML